MCVRDGVAVCGRLICGAWIICLLTGLGWPADVLTGSWKAVTVPPDPRTQRLVRIALTPSAETGGVRYAEMDKTVVEGMPGQHSQARDGQPLEYEFEAPSEGELGIRTVKSGRPLQWQAMRVAEGGNALLVTITSWDGSGRELQDGLYYRRVAESKCGIEWETKPESPLYGCWVWLDGQRILDRQPEPISIEASGGGYRLTSPTQTIELRKGGSVQVSGADTAAGKSPTSRWKAGKQGIEIALVAGSDKASGKMFLHLTAPDSLSVRVVNGNGSESAYTYRRQ